MKNISLITVSSDSIKFNVIPSTSSLSDNCIQDLMSDYNDLAVWTMNFHAKNGRESKNNEDFIYVGNLMDTIGSVIKSMI